MAIPPRPRRPGDGSRPDRPGIRRPLSAAPRATAPSASSDSPEAGARPAARPLRRKVVARRTVSSSGDTSHLPFIRIGVIVVIVGIGAIYAAVRDSSPNQRYFNKLVEMDQKMENEISGGSSNFRSRVEALPISGVTDPDLLELHQTLKQICNPPLSAQANPDDWLKQTIGKLHRLIDKANAKYAH